MLSRPPMATLFVSSALTRTARVPNHTGRHYYAEDELILHGCSTAFRLSPSPYRPDHPPPSASRDSAQICVREVSRPCNPCVTARCSDVVSEERMLEDSVDIFCVNHVQILAAPAGVPLRLTRSAANRPVCYSGGAHEARCKE